ncbi:MAG: hypothetical protein JXL85_05965 [Bacilli bacterium]|nr:hypothetical protein [Bacilli bacterium]
MVEFMLLLTMTVVFISSFIYMKKDYSIAIKWKHSGFSALISSVSVNLIFYYGVSTRIFEYLVILMVVFLVLDFHELNRHPITNESLKGHLRAVIFNGIIVSFMLNFSYLFITDLTYNVNFLFQTLLILLLIGGFIGIQKAYSKRIKGIRWINRILLPIVLLLTFGMISISSAQTISYEVHGEINPANPLLTKHSIEDRFEQTIIRKISDIRVEDNLVYYVVSQPSPTLYVYDIVTNQELLLLESDDGPEYQWQYIYIDAYGDDLYVQSQTGLYYLEGTVLTPMYLHNPSPDEKQFIDFYDCFYTDSFSDEDNTTTLFYDTKDTRYIVTGDKLEEAQGSYSIDWFVGISYYALPDEWADETVQTFYFSAKLHRFYVGYDGDVFCINSNYPVYDPLFYVSQNIYSYSFVGTSQISPTYPVEWNNRTYEYRSFDSTEADNQFHFAEKIIPLDDKLILFNIRYEWDHYYNSANMYFIIYEYSLSNLTLNTFPSNNLKSMYYVGILIFFIPLYRRQTQLYKL